MIEPSMAIHFARARRSYETARALRALPWAAFLGIFASLSMVLGTRPEAALLLAAAIAAFSWFSLWRGLSLGQAVLPGVLVGVIPFACAFAARSAGHVCTGTSCVSLCIPACSAGGVIAGLLIARSSRTIASSRDRRLYIVGAGLCSTLVGALGCSCVGYSGVLGLALGTMVATVPAALRAGDRSST